MRRRQRVALALNACLGETAAPRTSGAAVFATLPAMQEAGIPRVTLEIETRDGWTRIGSVTADEPPDSLTSATDDGGQDVYLFGWHDGHGPCVWRVPLGLADLETVADLRDQRAVIPITGRDGTANARFTYAS